MQSEMIILAADVFEIATRLINNTRTMLIGIATIGAIAVVIAAYVTTRALMPTLVAIVLSAVFLWGVNNADFLETTTRETIQQGGGSGGGGGGGGGGGSAIPN